MHNNIIWIGIIWGIKWKKKNKDIRTRRSEMIKWQLISYMQNDVRSSSLLVISSHNILYMKFNAKFLVYNYTINVGDLYSL